MAVGFEGTTVFVLLATGTSLLFAAFQFLLLSRIRLGGKEKDDVEEGTAPLLNGAGKASSAAASGGGGTDGVGVASTEKDGTLRWVAEEIARGARSFLIAEYTICAYFVAIFGAVIFVLISWGQQSVVEGALTTVAFVFGACTSIVCGYIGMMVAVFGNVRTTLAAKRSLDATGMHAAGWTAAFNAAFRAGSVMGFALCGLGLLVLYALLSAYARYFSDPERDWAVMMDVISGYGLGGSSIAMFGRVGGGIYTKAADVGADLVGKVVHGIPEDDPRNPATIADNVGDNVGDVAGMGADLFGSFAESTCAALVLGAKSSALVAAGWGAVLFPLYVAGGGILVCLVTGFVATDLRPVRCASDVELALKLQLIVSTALTLPVVYALAHAVLPAEFALVSIGGRALALTPTTAFVCVAMGTVGGLLIGLVTEFYTSASYAPVRAVARSCRTGAATNIIYGMSLGYRSTVVPVATLAATICVAFRLGDLYGCALAAVGMLATLATGLTIDGYGPVCDNAGGIAEMAELDPRVREVTDTLDAAGNTTAAIGKGFAIGSAALVSLALFGAFAVRVGVEGVDVFDPIVFAFLLLGALLPFWFSALTMQSVGLAAMQMVEEVSRQFRENPALLDETSNERPNYDACIQISTQASLKEMIAPGALVMLSPLIAGTLFGIDAVCGLLTGALVSGVQMAISMSNSGGAWDNAKKYIEADPSVREAQDRDLGGKGGDTHKAAVVGDTVGDPFKDTSGPALNILMKLMAIISLVFAEYFRAINGGHGLFNIVRSAS